MARELNVPAGILAAGGVVWRTAPRRPEVAVVHRPKYDDWSLPKGKLLPGEHVLLAAVREVGEEAGTAVTLGRPLGYQRYSKRTGSGSVPKTSYFWSMRATADTFEPNEEVDDVVWLPVTAARMLVDLRRDRRTLDAFAARPASTAALVLARHASAGERDSWSGPDEERPLDALGRRQAEGLAAVLRLYGISRVLAADVTRCLDTVAPYAQRADVHVAADPLFGEAQYAEHAGASRDRLLTLMDGGEPTVVCSQGKVIPKLLRDAARSAKFRLPSAAAISKGAFWVLHRRDGSWIAAERHVPAVLPG